MSALMISCIIGAIIVILVIRKIHQKIIVTEQKIKIPTADDVVVVQKKNHNKKLALQRLTPYLLSEKPPVASLEKLSKYWLKMGRLEGRS